MFAPPPAARDEEAQLGNSPEIQRRQQMMRFGLIMFLVFLLLDNKQRPGNRSNHNGRSGTGSDNSEYSEIPLNAVYSSKINEILAKDRTTRIAAEHPMNGTGLYRGSWSSTLAYANGTQQESGSALLQLVAVPIRSSPDIAFLYGLLHMYKDAHKDKAGTTHVSLEAGFPLQGVLVSSKQKLVLFSTPYKSQRLYLRIGSEQHFNDSAPLLLSALPDPAPRPPSQRRLRDVSSDPFLLGSPAQISDSLSLSLSAAMDQHPLHGLLKAALNPQHWAQFGAVVVEEGRAAKRRALTANLAALTGPNLLQALGMASVVPARAREVKLTELTPAGYLSVLLTDQPLQAHPAGNSTANDRNSSSSAAQNATEPEEGFLVSIAVGEAMLPARFKALQSAATPPSMTISLQPNRSSSGDKYTTLPAECQHTLQLSGTSQSASTPTDVGQVSLPVPIDPEGDGEGAESEAPRDTAHSPPVVKQKAKRLEPLLQVQGAVHSQNCDKEYTLGATAFNLELDTLKSKIDAYAFVANSLALVQVFLVVFQMKHANTQATVSRVSIVAVFAQSLLDANLCMVHLLLSFAFPTLFFGSFIWIAIIKLLLFSVFQMRLIINIYIARYAQELSAEGWQGLRARMIALHVRFYGAVLFLLLVSVVFYSRPVVAVLALYSFWVPQIFHSIYSGTKHSLHPTYLIGTTFTRLFIPLYVLGCPRNFITMLSVYINPQYLAVLSDTAVGNTAASLRDLPPAYLSACWVLVLWLGAQVCVLLLQSTFGPRFFVPKRFLPQRYDYKRPIPANVRATILISPSPRSSTSGPTAESGNRDTTGDVAMTGIRSRGLAAARNSSSNIPGGLQALLFGTRSSSGRSPSEGLEVSGEDHDDLETGSLLGSHGDSAAPGTSGGASIPERRDAGTGTEAECVICYNSIHLGSNDHNADYMITPCDHVFHEGCLVQWAEVKMECPVCRAALPALGDDGH